MTDLYDRSGTERRDLLPSVLDVDVGDVLAKHSLKTRAVGSVVGLVAAAFGSFVVVGGQAGQLLFGMFLSLAFLWTALVLVAGARWGLARVTSRHL